MTPTIITDTSLVFDYVASRMPLNMVEGMTGLGLSQEGKLVAGVIYEGYNGKNVWMHVAAEPGARWMTKAYLKTCFAYPFVILGVNRVSGYVNASNLDARRFDEHLGFKQEAVLSGAAYDGGDVIIYAMWKKDCRYVTNNS